MQKDIFSTIKEERGGLANIHLAFTNFPESVSAHYDFYKAVILNENLPLKRVQREALAYFASEANECPYCVGHHKEAYEKQIALEQIKDSEVELFKDLAVCLTKEPWKANLFEKKFFDAGFSKSEWLHSVVVVSYFNMANRLAFATGIELEDGFEETCN